MRIQPDPFLNEHLSPSPSPWKQKFRDMGVLQKQVAYACGISGGHMSELMNGYRPLTDDHEMKFREFEAQVRMIRLMDGADSCNS